MDLPSDGTAPEDALRQPVRGLQIIHGAMVAGVVAYLAFALFFKTPERELAGLAPRGVDSSTFTIALLFAAAAVIASVVVPPIVGRRFVRMTALGQPLPGLQDGPPSPALLALDPITRGLFGARQTSLIVGMAILDAATFFAVLVLSQGNVPGWFVAVPIGLIALMAIRFPTRAGVADWIDARRAEIDAGLHG